MLPACFGRPEVLLRSQGCELGRSVDVLSAGGIHAGATV